MNNAVRPFSAVSPALHPSIRLVFFTFNYSLFFSLSLMFLHTYPPSFAARAQLTLFLLSDSAKAMLHFRELLSPTFSLLTPTHHIPSLPYSLSMFSFSPYIFTILRPSPFSVDLLLFFSYRIVPFRNRYAWRSMSTNNRRAIRTSPF